MTRRLTLAGLWALILLAVLGAGGAPRVAGQAGAQPSALYAETKLWQTCYPGNYCETGWYASPAVADLQHASQPSVLWGGSTLMAINGATGAIEWHAAPSHNRLWPSIAVADLLGNGQLEVVTGQSGGYVTVYDSAGHLLPGWPQQPNHNEIRSLAVAPLNAAGSHQQEIIAATTNGPTNTGGPQLAPYIDTMPSPPAWAMAAARRGVDKADKGAYWMGTVQPASWVKRVVSMKVPVQCCCCQRRMLFMNPV